jgi:hypothetical protein
VSGSLQAAEVIVRRSIRQNSRRFAAVTAAVLVLSCNGEQSSPEPVAFSDDELYLIESYSQVSYARSYFPYQPAVAESLFTFLSATVDTVRINSTIVDLRNRPERWLHVFNEIEARLRKIKEQRNRETELEKS